MPEVEKRRKTIINVVYFAMIIAIGLFVIRYALGVCFPFVFAFVVAAILQRPKNFIVRKTFLKNGFTSVLLVFLSIFIILALVSLIGVRVYVRVQDFVNYITIQFQDVNKIVDNIETWLFRVAGSLPDFLHKTLNENLTQLFSSLREYISGQSDELSQQITSGIGGNFQMSWITGPLSGFISTAKQIPSILIAVVITLVASCFMTTAYPEVMEFFKSQFPENRKNDIERAKILLKESLGKMGKAYLLIILITFIEMSVGLTVLRLIGVFDSAYIMIIAAVTAIIDIIPVLGTGTILVPWAAYSLITGKVGLGIGLIVIYALITVIRQVIEPKLVAGQLGLSPIVSIASLYFGLKIFGVLGMFITPILVIMLKLLNDEGIISLWKSPVRLRAQKAAEEEKMKAEAAKPEGEEKNKE